MTSSLSDSSLTALTEPLRQANEEFMSHYPGEGGRRQPVHTVYGGAHLFKSDTAKRLGSLARRSLDQFAPDFLSFARAVELPGSEELPDSVEEANDLVSFLKNEPERARREQKGAWLAYTIYRRVTKNFNASRLKTFASISKTDTGIGPMKKKMATRCPPLLKQPTEVRTAVCRRSLVFASSRSTRNCVLAVFARSRFLSRHWSISTEALCPTTLS